MLDTTRAFHLLSIPALLALVGCATVDVAVDATPETSTGVVAETSAFAIVNGERVPPPDIEMGDPETIARILNEGKNHNRVMDHLTYLCEEIGPRPHRLDPTPSSPTSGRATQFEAWGLSNAHLFEWGEVGLRFDRLPSSARVLVEETRLQRRQRRARRPRAPHHGVHTGSPGRAAPTAPSADASIPMPRTLEEYAGQGTISTAPGSSSGPTTAAVVASAASAARWAPARSTSPSSRSSSKPATLTSCPSPRSSSPETTTASPASGSARSPAPGAPDGITYEIDMLRDDGMITGEAGIPGYRVSAMKDATFDDETDTLTFTWESSSGDAPVTMIVTDQRNDRLPARP